MTDMCECPDCGLVFDVTALVNQQMLDDPKGAGSFVRFCPRCGEPDPLQREERHREHITDGGECWCGPTTETPT